MLISMYSSVSDPTIVDDDDDLENEGKLQHSMSQEQALQNASSSLHHHHQTHTVVLSNYNTIQSQQK